LMPIIWKVWVKNMMAIYLNGISKQLSTKLRPLLDSGAGLQRLYQLRQNADRLVDAIAVLQRSIPTLQSTG